MHRIVYGRGISSIGMLAALLTLSPRGAADDTPQNLGPQPLIADYAKDDETFEGISKLPNLAGDRETHRRNMLMRAWQEKRDPKKPEAQKLKTIYDWVKAADGIRSSSFTRCNLGLLAHELGHDIEAASHFRAEFQTRFPHDGSQHQKLVRDVCEIVGRLALSKVGELQIVAPEKSQLWLNTQLMGKAPLLGSVFVKPNEDYVVRAQLHDGHELRETISLGAGESRTLELKSAKKTETVSAGLPFVPRRERSAGELALAKPPEPSLKTAALYAGAGVGALGFVMGAIGMGLGMYANHALDTTMTEDKKTCRVASQDRNRCGELFDKITTSTTLMYTGIAGLSLGSAGFLIYAFYPEHEGPKRYFSQSMPTGLGMRGHW